MVEKPAEVAHAELIEAICRRYGCLPSEAEREPLTTLRHMALLDLAHGETA